MAREEAIDCAGCPRKTTTKRAALKGYRGGLLTVMLQGGSSLDHGAFFLCKKCHETLLERLTDPKKRLFE